jgi:GMP synthase (glutamine-hydrolysing)
VGVQGDSRTYAPVLAIDTLDHDRASELINSIAGINRVVGCVRSRVPLDRLSVEHAALSAMRLSRLRAADTLVRRICHETGFDREVWQFPVVLIPLGAAPGEDSVVLRPIHSVDGMTARSVVMPAAILDRIAGELLCLHGVAAVFYDLTHKPPGTIEWE